MKDDLLNALLLKDDAKKGYIALVYGGLGALGMWFFSSK